jgi:hypothetical protein
MKYPARVILTGVCLWTIWCCQRQPLWAQGNLGSISGLVLDPSGALIPGALVSVRHLETNSPRSMLTDSAGLYSFTSLAVGTYELNVSAVGFQPVRIASIKVDVNGRVRVDVSMKVGQESDRVTVEAAAPLLKVEDASMGQLIEQKRVTELPLNGRDFQQLQLLSPGSISTYNFQATSGLGGGASSVSMTASPTMNVANGNRPGAVLFTIDGSSASNQVGRGITITPTIDEIQEFQFLTQNMTAEFGYGSSAVNVSIKSGTNQLHGLGYEFLRNGAMDARSFFASGAEDLKRNQFGGNIGGPVVLPKYNGKDRTFWFFSYEGLRLRDATTQAATVPTANMRAGDFSELPNPLYDPATTRPNPNVINGFLRDPFPGNVIPSNRIDPVASFFFQPSWIPLPIQPGITANLRRQFSIPTDANQLTAKIDQRFGSKDVVFARYSWRRENDGSFGPYHGLSPVDPGAQPKNDYANNEVLNWTHIFNASNVLELRGGRNRGEVYYNTPNIGATDYTSDVLHIQGYGPGLSNVYPTFPTMTIPGWTGVPTGYVLDFLVKSVDVSANFTMIRGRHTFKFGDTYHNYREWEASSGHIGTFTFNGGYTNNPASPANTGSPMADFFLGEPQTAARQITGAGMDRQQRNNWAYANDDWKLSKNLTLNLGVRYEYDQPFWDKNGQLAGFAPNARNGQGAILVENAKAIAPPYRDAVTPRAIDFYRPLIVFASDVGLSEKYLRNMAKFHLTNWSPRLGLAYRLNPKTVVRTAYGIYHVPFDGNKGLQWSFPFLVSETGIPNSPLGAAPKTTQTILPLGSSFSTTPGLTTTNPDDKDLGYVQQWNFSIQRELPSRFSVDIAYVGTKGTRLQRGYIPSNTPVPGPGDIQSRRPWPQFGANNSNDQSASSIYHALQFRLERRFYQGLSLLSAFTWSKAIDDDSSATNTVYDIYNRRRDRGQSDFNVPRVFTTSIVYELPWLRRANGFRSTLLGGWSLGSILTLQDGFPYTPMVNNDPANIGTASRADVVAGCDPHIGNPTPQRWFNTSCFVSPPGAPIYRLGNAGRNILRGDWYHNTDLSLFKRFAFTETKSVQVRFEAFNAFNIHTFAFPNAIVNSSAYGIVTTSSPGRILQVAAKMSF